jgi:hypothetical protein
LPLWRQVVTRYMVQVRRYVETLNIRCSVVVLLRSLRLGHIICTAATGARTASAQRQSRAWYMLMGCSWATPAVELLGVSVGHQLAGAP